eukprot:NODE_278_length_10899_cov_0.613704.p4 type:complete len:113 gc:universal NODE_278_length_10899_cov_0.613704:2374-2712(+)
MPESIPVLLLELIESGNGNELNLQEDETEIANEEDASLTAVDDTPLVIIENPLTRLAPQEPLYPVERTKQDEYVTFLFVLMGNLITFNGHLIWLFEIFTTFGVQVCCIQLDE